MLIHFSYVPQMPGFFSHDKFWIPLFLTTELKIKCWCRTMSVGSLGAYKAEDKNKQDYTICNTWIH